MAWDAMNSSVDLLAQSMIFNDYNSSVCEEACAKDPDPDICKQGCEVCSIDNIINEKIDLAKLALYNYTKPSIILKMGAKEGPGVNNTCNWTNDTIKAAYEEFYDRWIPIMAGAGIIGAAQYCYSDPCPDYGYYGLYSERQKEKDWTTAWFKEGCGRYYYEAEGLTPLTFSTYETNYSMCDPSRMFALIQQMKCLEEKLGTK
jgi:hypothetical protein